MNQKLHNITPKIYTIKINDDGRVAKNTKRTYRFMAERAKNMADEYYRMAFMNAENEGQINPDIEATRVAILGLAVEIYLKSILYDRVIIVQRKKVKKTDSLIMVHNLKELFDSLPLKIKKAIHIRARLDKYSEEEFDNMLENLGRVFEKYRYCYELFEVEYLLEQMTCLTNIIKEVIERYWCDNDLRLWNMSEYSKEISSRSIEANIII